MFFFKSRGLFSLSLCLAATCYTTQANASPSEDASPLESLRMPNALAASFAGSKLTGTLSQYLFGAQPSFIGTPLAVGVAGHLLATQMQQNLLPPEEENRRLRLALLRKQLDHQKTFADEHMQKHLGAENAKVFQQRLDSELRESPSTLIRLTEELADTRQKPNWLDETVPYSLSILRRIVCWFEDPTTGVLEVGAQWVSALPSQTTKEDRQSFFFWKMVNCHDTLTAKYFNNLNEAQQNNFTEHKNKLILDQNEHSKEFLRAHLQNDEVEALEKELTDKKLYDQRKLLSEKINALPNKTKVTRFLTEINKKSLLRQRTFVEDHLKSLPEHDQQAVKEGFNDAIALTIVRFATQHIDAKPGQTKESQLEQCLNSALIMHKAWHLIQKMALVLPNAQKNALPSAFSNAMVDFQKDQIDLMNQCIKNSLAHQQSSFPRQAVWGSTLALLATPIVQAYGFGLPATLAAAGALAWNQMSAYPASFVAQKLTSTGSFLSPWAYSIISGALHGCCPPVSVNEKIVSVTLPGDTKHLWAKDFQASLNKNALEVKLNEGFHKVPTPNNYLQACTNRDTYVAAGARGKFGSILWGSMQSEGGPTSTNETALATRAPCKQITVFAPVDSTTSAEETALAIRFP